MKHLLRKRFLAIDFDLHVSDNFPPSYVYCGFNTSKDRCDIKKVETSQKANVGKQSDNAVAGQLVKKTTKY